MYVMVVTAVQILLRPSEPCQYEKIWTPSSTMEFPGPLLLTIKFQPYAELRYEKTFIDTVCQKRHDLFVQSEYGDYSISFFNDFESEL